MTALLLLLLQVPFDMKEIADQLFSLLTSLESEAHAVHKARQSKKVTVDDLELASILLEVVQGMKKEIGSDPDKLKVCVGGEREQEGGGRRERGGRYGCRGMTGERR